MPRNSAIQTARDIPAEVYNNRWFASLSAAHQAALLSAATKVSLKDGQTVWRRNTMVSGQRLGFALLVAGSLKVSSSTDDGREAILTFVQPGQWFGELALLDQRSRERDVSSVGESQLLVVAPAAFEALMEDRAFAASVVDLLASRTRMMLHLLEDFSLRTTRSRAARRLIMLASDDDPYSPPMRKSLNLSHDSLASMMGITRPALATQLKSLTQMGAITQGYGQISITSIVTLMAEAAAG